MNQAIATTENKGTDLIMNPVNFSHLQAFSQVMATGRATVPSHFQGNEGDCLAVTMQAVQWGMNPFAVAQKTHVIGGVLGYEAQLVNAVITSMAPTKDRLHYEWGGNWEKIIGIFTTKQSQKGGTYQAPGWKPEDEKGLYCKVWATLKGEDEPRELTIFMQQATVRNSTLWASDPKQQLAYLATKRWARLYCPDVILGVYTRDELEELPAQTEIDMGIISSAKDINAMLKQKEIEPKQESEAAPEPEFQQPLMTMAEIKKQLNFAKTVDELNQLKDPIRALPADQTAECKTIFSTKKAEILGAQK